MCRYATLDTVDIAQLMLPMFLGAAFSSVSLSALLLVKQREKKVLHALRLAGLSRSEYWIAQFFFDAAFGLLLVLVAVVCAFAFNATWFTATGEQMGAFVLVLVVAAWAVAVMGYALSACFQSAAAAARILPIAVMAATIMPYLIAWIMQSDADAGVRADGRALSKYDAPSDTPLARRANTLSTCPRKHRSVTVTMSLLCVVVV